MSWLSLLQECSVPFSKLSAGTASLIASVPAFLGVYCHQHRATLDSVTLIHVHTLKLSVYKVISYSAFQPAILPHTEAGREAVSLCGLDPGKL